LYQREHVIGVLALLIFFGLSDKISEAALAHRGGERILTSNLARITGFAPVPS
jgi:hypothetical protein